MTNDINNVAASDLAERLRGVRAEPVCDGTGVRWSDDVPKINHEAADRIEKLEDALRKIVDLTEDYSHEIQHIAKEVLADGRA